MFLNVSSKETISLIVLQSSPLMVSEPFPCIFVFVYKGFSGILSCLNTNLVFMYALLKVYDVIHTSKPCTG